MKVTQNFILIFVNFIRLCILLIVFWHKIGIFCIILDFFWWFGMLSSLIRSRMSRKILDGGTYAVIAFWLSDIMIYLIFKFLQPIDLSLLVWVFKGVVAEIDILFQELWGFLLKFSRIFQKNGVFYVFLKVFYFFDNFSIFVWRNPRSHIYLLLAPLYCCVYIFWKFNFFYWLLIFFGSCDFLKIFDFWGGF